MYPQEITAYLEPQEIEVLNEILKTSKQKYVVKVNQLIKEGEGLTFKKEFVEVPMELYEMALEEKNGFLTHVLYSLEYERGGLPKHRFLVGYIQYQLKGRIDGTYIKRIYK